KFVLNHFDARTSQLAEAPTIFSTVSEDETTAIWRASRAICEEDLGRDDRRLVVIVETHLREGLEALSLADNMAAIIEALCSFHPSNAAGRAHAQIGVRF
ncbi:MAG TPA: hypothetical protein VFD87_10880, partial [Phototrophicaceae bacterium]|nr:hypothetical protein [Phototrophicaceae bacterium]